MIDLANSHWPIRNEKLWFGDIDSKRLHIFSDHLTNLLKDFFYLQQYKIDINQNNYNSSTSLDQVSKLAYLLPQYLQTKSFRDPFCTHYNPRLGEYVVHPGGTRQIILDLFHEGTIKTWYFDTEGRQPSLLKNFRPVDLTKVFFQGSEDHMCLVPDHGTFIPHILKGSGVSALPQAQVDAHNLYKKKLTDPNYKIYTNSPDYKVFRLWNTHKEKKANVVVTFNFDSLIPNDQLTKLYNKITLLILIGQDYSDSYVTVRHK
jgi:hypothetical protein